MIKSTTRKDKASITLNIVVDEAFISPYRQAVLKRLKKDLKIPGFRPGNAPDNIAIREIGENRVQAEVLQEVIEHAYNNQIREQKVEPLGSPKIELKKFVPFTELEFSAKTPIMPEIKFDYSKLKIKQPEIKVSDKQIDEAIEILRKQLANRVSTNEPIKKGDEVRFDFEGTREGKPVEGAAAQNHVMVVGEGSFIPGFEENLIGLKEREEKTFTITFPKDYHIKNLAGKKVDFKVKINNIYQVNMPEVNDDFAQRAGNKKTVRLLREDIRKALTEQEQQRVKKEFENKVLNEVLDKAKFDAPQELVEQQKYQLEHEMDENLKNSGLDRKKYLEIQKRQAADLERELIDEATKRVKGALILRDLIIKNNITVSDIELDTEIASMRELYKSDDKIQEELGQEHFRDDLRNHILTQKALKVLTDFVSS